MDVPTTPQKDPFDRDAQVQLNGSAALQSANDLSQGEQPKSMTITLKSRSPNGRDYVLTVTPEPGTSGADDRQIAINQNAVEDGCWEWERRL